MKVQCNPYALDPEFEELWGFPFRGLGGFHGFGCAIEARREWWRSSMLRRRRRQHQVVGFVLIFFGGTGFRDPRASPQSRIVFFRSVARASLARPYLFAHVMQVFDKWQVQSFRSSESPGAACSCLCGHWACGTAWKKHSRAHVSAFASRAAKPYGSSSSKRMTKLLLNCDGSHFMKSKVARQAPMSSP